MTLIISPVIENILLASRLLHLIRSILLLLLLASVNHCCLYIDWWKCSDREEAKGCPTVGVLPFVCLYKDVSERYYVHGVIEHCTISRLIKYSYGMVSTNYVIFSHSTVHPNLL